HPHTGAPYNPDFAAMARSAGIDGVNVDRPADLSDALRTALAARRPYLINANIGADKNPGGAGVWELPGLGQSQPAFDGRYRPHQSRSRDGGRLIGGCEKDVDARDKHGHDDSTQSMPCDFFSPAASAAAAHLTVSRAMNRANSSGGPPSGSNPCARSLATTSSDASAPLAAALSLSITARGVPAGPPHADPHAAPASRTPPS